MKTTGSEFAFRTIIILSYANNLLDMDASTYSCMYLENNVIKIHN